MLEEYILNKIMVKITTRKNEDDNGLFYDYQDGRNDCDSTRRDESDDNMVIDGTSAISASPTAHLVHFKERRKPIRVTFVAMISNGLKNEHAIIHHHMNKIMKTQERR